MRDLLELCPAPIDEQCLQFGTDQYTPENARKECKAFVNQLERLAKAGAFGTKKSSNQFSVKSFKHDLGTYYEAVVTFDDSDEESVQFMLKVGSNLPSKWDEEAKRKLGPEYFLAVKLSNET